MFRNSRFSKFINKINPVIIFVLLLFVSLIFDGVSIYGINNSSFVSQERYVADTQKEAGKDIHIGFSMESSSQASILSLLSPMNEYNAYRIKENGRRVTYVNHTEYTITYKSEVMTSHYFMYDDKGPINNSVSANRFVLEKGSFENLDKDNYVFISYDTFYNRPFIDGLNEVIGQTIKFSFAGDKEFIIGGIIRETVGNESGLHVKRLFSESFVLFGNQLVKEYGYNSLMFTSNDTDFQVDYNEFINAYNKSFLSFKKARFSISSVKDDEALVRRNLTGKYEVSSSAHTASFLSVLIIVLIAPIYLAILLFYDFNKVKLYYKIPAALALTGYQLGAAFYLADKVKKGMFMAKLSISFFITFMIISLASYIFVFLLYNLGKKEKTEDKNNG